MNKIIQCPELIRTILEYINIVSHHHFIRKTGQEYDIGTTTKLNFIMQNSYEMVSLNNTCCLNSAETDNFNTTYILRMFTPTPTNGTR